MLQKTCALALLLFVSAHTSAQDPGPCASTAPNVDRLSVTSGILSGTIKLAWNKGMCITAKSLLLKNDLEIITQGNALDIIVDEDLVSEKGAQISAYDYGVELQNSLYRYTQQPNPTPFDPPVPTYITGPRTGGNPAGGDGRTGADARHVNPTGYGNTGMNGKSPSQITVVAKQSAAGYLKIVAAGTTGLRGSAGADAKAPGNGEQGAAGQKNIVNGCASGPGAGGNGGAGGRGGKSSDGGDGGNGGMIILDIPVNTQFFLEADVSAADGGIAGLPGVSSNGGKPGCGGEQGPGFCTPVVWSWQGFYGRPAARYPPGNAGITGHRGAIQAPNANVTQLGGEVQACAPFSPPTPEDRIPLDLLQQMALLGAIAQQSFGAEPRYPNESLVPMQILDVKSANGWVAQIDRRAVENYTNYPPLLPVSPLPSGCHNADCCKPSPSLICLNAPTWDFDSSSPKTRYLLARKAWLEEFKKVIAIEIAKNSIDAFESDLISSAKEGESWLKWYPASNFSLFTKIDDDLFARIAFLFSQTQSQLRTALYLPVAPSSQVLACSAGAVHAIGSPIDLAQIGYAEVRVGPINPVKIFGQSQSQYFSLPAYYHGDEMIFGPPTLSPTAVPIAGYENTQYCELISKMKRSEFYSPFSCSLDDSQLNSALTKLDRDIDFPGALSILFSERFIQAAVSELPSDIPTYVADKLYCPMTPFVDDN